MTQSRNALGNETSPYLLQHDHNPVHWYPWGEEALTLARELDRPILLSIGYSACHWCHVMAHESFEDEETAELMNTLFINIKVDREERPDLDKIYQTAHQLLAQRPGGWPLTMFLTADRHIPFFGGTYFPNEERHNLPAFKSILRRVAEVYRDHRDDLEQQNQAIVTALQDLAAPRTAAETVLNAIPIDAARRQLEQNFDAQYGGFGDAPKFPHPTNLEGLLRHGSASGDPRSHEMALFTLRKMALGGVYDQLGGGFCRYSVDDVWMIPHFEKMLYDNGPLLALYAQAWQVSGESLFKRVTHETADWVMREMQSPEGGYYSTLDADSEEGEGRFYVWTPEQAQALLDEDDYRLLARHYGLDREANFEGRWNLHVYVDEDTLASEFELGTDEVRSRLHAARATLFQAREQREQPGRDEKVLTAWNGLMIKGMAVAGRLLQRPELIDSACHAVDFIREHLWQEGRLLATYKDGRARLHGYLDDYAFLLDGLLELLQARWRTKDLHFARVLADALLIHFEDRQSGGFFFTADDHETLIQRPKPLGDESMPSGNGMAAYALGRLGHLLGEHRYLEAAERTLKSAWSAIEHLPYAHNALLLALEENLYPPRTIVLRGKPEEMQVWSEKLNGPYTPRQMVFYIDESERGLPGLLGERKATDSVTAYVCQGTVCRAPAQNLDAFLVALKDY